LINFIETKKTLLLDLLDILTLVKVQLSTH